MKRLKKFFLNLQKQAKYLLIKKFEKCLKKGHILKKGSETSMYEGKVYLECRRCGRGYSRLLTIEEYKQNYLDSRIPIRSAV